ncbi:DUF4412 domain-containing protein [Kordia algicida OT-1]|uniref:DUF4412 domain-containing protein n=1 Tax=Kordia algicida OT-1 TaxID=391587 RepID=A9E2G5_9FLAO|nr:DUF4412 domain-containing protein [Kordia algicida]EDP95387.1 hypothetical protein KAOT1_10706 [Kordia algicida OT-1]
MKKILVAVALAFSVMSFAQEKITEGKIIMKQKMSTDNEQVQAQFDMIGDMESLTYFKDSSSRSELSNPMSGDIVTIINAEKNEMLMLMDNPAMGKIYVREKNLVKEEDVNKIKVVKGDKTKKVLGYTCTQYTATIEKDGVKMEMEMYTTEALNIPSQQTSVLGDKLKGFPLYMIIRMNQMGADIEVTSEVTKIEKQEVSSELFDLTAPEGYKDMNKQ